MTWERTSASQIKTFKRCPKKWWLEKIKDHKSPPSRATQRGQLIHAMIELCLIEGTEPDPKNHADVETDLLHDEDFSNAPRIALAMLENLDEEPGRTPSKRVEHKMLWQPEGAPVPILGFIDLLDGYVGEATYGITDHKTRSRIGRYTPTEEELRIETQALVYGGYIEEKVSAKRPGISIAFRHNNGQTSGNINKTTTVTCVWKPGEATAGFREHVLPAIQEQAVVAKEEDPLKVLANPEACGDFGGCPHRGRCMEDGSIKNPLSGISNKETKPLHDELAWLNADPAPAKKEEVDPPKTNQPHTFAIGQAVEDATGTQSTVEAQVHSAKGEPVVRLSNGMSHYERELTAVTLAATPNPPDGVPMGDAYEAPVVEKKKAPRTRGFKVGGMTVSRLSKEDANATWTFLFAQLKDDTLAAYSEQSVLREKKKPTLAALKADVTLMFKLLNHADIEEVPQGDGAKQSAETEHQEKMKAASDPTLALQRSADAAEGTSKEEYEKGLAADGMPNRASIQAGKVMALKQTGMETENLSDAGIDAAFEALNTPESPEQAKERYMANTKRTLYVNCRPRRHVPHFVFDPDTIAKFIEKHNVHPLVYSDYGKTGYMLCAEALRRAIESGEPTPSELFIDTRQHGGREALAVLEAFYDDIVSA